MQPLSGNQRLDILTSLMNMSLVLRLPREMHFCRSSSNVNAFETATKPPRFAHFWQGAQSLAPATQKTSSERSKVLRTCHLLHFWLGNMLRATTACAFATCQLPKAVRHWGALYMLTWKSASCHTRVHFFNMATAESVPTLARFVHFDLETRSAPQCAFSTFQFPKVLRSWRALYICRFWLQNVLRATTACNFSSLIWPDGSTPAAVASLLFDLPDLPNWKDMVTWGLEARTKSTFSAAAYQ